MAPKNQPHDIASFFDSPSYDAPKRGIGGIVKKSVWDPDPTPTWHAPPSLAKAAGSTFPSTASSSNPDVPQWGVSTADAWPNVDHSAIANSRKSYEIWEFLDKYEVDYQAVRKEKWIPGSKDLVDARVRRNNAKKNNKPSNKQKVVLMERIPETPHLWTSRNLPPSQKRVDAWDAASMYDVIFNEWTNTFTLVPGLFEDVDPLPSRYVQDDAWASTDGFKCPDEFFRPYLVHPEWKRLHPPSIPTPANPPIKGPSRPQSPPPPTPNPPTPRASQPTRLENPPRRDTRRTRDSDTRRTTGGYCPPPSHGSTYRPRYDRDRRSPRPRGDRRSRSPRRNEGSSRGEGSRPTRRSRSRSRTIASSSRSSTPRNRRRSVSRVSRSPPPRRNPSPHTPPPRTPQAARPTREQDVTPNSWYSSEDAHRSSPQSPTISALDHTSPMTPLSSVSDDASGSFSPVTPQEENNAPFVMEGEANDGNVDTESVPPATKQVEVDLSDEIVVEPIEPFAPEDTEMDDGMAPDEGAPAPNVLPQFDPFTEYMYFRFGFTHPTDGPPYPDLESWTGALSDAEFNTLLAKLNYRDSAFADAELRKAVYHFTLPMIKQVDPPPGLWDLNYQNPRSLVRDAARVTVSDLTEVTARPLYRLQSGIEEHDWILIVQDPSIAVECLRRELLSTHDIVYFFLRRGTPFTIGHVGASSTMEDDTNLIPTIPEDFQPDLEHFERWETAVRDFLASPRGHLVWRLGGLYWRIAHYIMGTIPGPQDMIEHDTGFITVKLRSGLYEEPLTPAEIAIVVGLFNVKNVNPNAPPMRMSYFPHPNAAEGTTVLSSAWTPLCEEWFFAHLESIRHGGPGWRSQNAWRKVLRGAITAHPSNRRLEGYNRELAEEWLKL